MTTNGPITLLREFLMPQSADARFDEHADALGRLLSASWDEFAGGDEAGMAAHKIIGRAYNFCWKPPVLYFEIERHGAATFHSTRAERQKWTVDLDQLTARHDIVGFRQIGPRAPKFDAKPLAQHCAQLISERRPLPSEWKVKWISDEEVDIAPSSLISDPSEFAQTRQGQSRRMRLRLKEEFKARGWKSEDRGNFIRFRRSAIRMI